MQAIFWRWAGVVAVAAAAFLIGLELRFEQPLIDQPGCDSDDVNLTIAQIASPQEDQAVVIGTKLQWYRTGHDLCGEGRNKRYTVAICGESLAGLCSRANGFYNYSVSPADLGWDDGHPGVYTLTADDIAMLRERAADPNVEGPLAIGARVYLQIRYDYDDDSGRHHYDDWDTQALTLGASLKPTAVPQPPELSPPGGYTPSDSVDMSWQDSVGATHYRIQLAYRMGDAGGSDAGALIRMSRLREVADTTISYTEPLPVRTSLIGWSVQACNTGGCSESAVTAVPVDPPVARSYTSFAAIEPAFRAPSCVNCHAVLPTDGQRSSAAGYEDPAGTNFGLPPQHPTNVTAETACIGCHRPNLLPRGPHVIHWHAPEGMDLRGRTSAELCVMAKDRGTIAEDAKDHLLGDPLILWAVEGGPLPLGRGNTDDAFDGDWEATVTAWFDDGMHCN